MRFRWKDSEGRGLRASWAWMKTVADALSRAGWRPDMLRKCENCGRRRAVWTNAEESYCLRCEAGFMTPETMQWLRNVRRNAQA